MNAGQLFGELQLRISELEEGGAYQADQDELPAIVDRQLREALREADESKKRELAALLKLTEAKRYIVEQEQLVTDLRAVTAAAAATAAQLRRTQAQLADAERALRDLKTRPAAEPLESQPTTATADLEAKLRGKDMEIADLKRRLEDAMKAKADAEKHAARAQAATSDAEKLVRQLTAQLDEARQESVESVCPTCEPILSIVRREVVAAIKDAGIGASKTNTRQVIVRAQSMRHLMLGALECVDAPVTAAQIALAIGREAPLVERNIWHLVKSTEVRRLGQPGGYGRKGQGYRYWLASRPLPQEANS